MKNAPTQQVTRRGTEVPNSVQPHGGSTGAVFLRYVRAPLSVFAILYAALVAYVLVSGTTLPERVATHFDAEGRANGWSSVQEHMIFTIVSPMALLGFCALLYWLTWKFPAALPLNVPHKEHWASPEHRPEAVMIMGRSLLWFCALLTLFISGIHCQLDQANRTQPPLLDNSLHVPGMIVFFSLILLWLVNLLLAYTKIDLSFPTCPGPAVKSRKMLLVAGIIVFVVVLINLPRLVGD